MQTRLDRVSPFLKKINSYKTDKDKTDTLDGLFQMGVSEVFHHPDSASAGQVCRTPYVEDGPVHHPPFGRGKGGGTGRGNGGVGGVTPKKVLSLEMTQVIHDEGGCVGHVQDDCKYESDCKFPHFSNGKL